MSEYLDDPSVLTKDKLKSELLANNVELPSGNPTKEVYVQLYLKNLTAQNKKHVAATTLDAFSSDEELPPPVVSNTNRSSGRKATRKTEKVRPDELDVTILTDEGLREELLKYSVGVGPVVATTRKLYEKKLQKLQEDGFAQPQPQVVLTGIQVTHNGTSESDLYSDKEDEVTTEPEPKPNSVPVAEPEPPPVIEKWVRSHGKTSITRCTSSSHHHAVEKIAAGEQMTKVDENNVLKELFNDTNSPTGITATCRRPIRGAAGRPVKSSDLWNNENSLFFPKTTTKTSSSLSSYTEQLNNFTSLPSSDPSTAFTSSATSRLLSTAPPAGLTKALCHRLSLWIKLFLLAVVAAFLFLVYQAMESNTDAPFGDLKVSSDSTG